MATDAARKDHHPRPRVAMGGHPTSSRRVTSAARPASWSRQADYSPSSAPETNPNRAIRTDRQLRKSDGRGSARRAGHVRRKHARRTSQVFTADITTGIGRCRGCGHEAAIASLKVYRPSPGIVGRCPGCDDVSLCNVQTHDSLWRHIDQPWWLVGGRTACRRISEIDRRSESGPVLCFNSRRRRTSRLIPPPFGERIDGVPGRTVKSQDPDCRCRDHDVRQQQPEDQQHECG